MLLILIWRSEIHGVDVLVWNDLCWIPFFDVKLSLFNWKPENFHWNGRAKHLHGRAQALHGHFREKIWKLWILLFCTGCAQDVHGHAHDVHGRAHTVHGHSREKMWVLLLCTGCAHDVHGRARDVHGRARDVHGRARDVHGRAHALHGLTSKDCSVAKFWDFCMGVLLLCTGVQMACTAWEPIFILLSILFGNFISYQSKVECYIQEWVIIWMNDRKLGVVWNCDWYNEPLLMRWGTMSGGSCVVISWGVPHVLVVIRYCSWVIDWWDW